METSHAHNGNSAKNPRSKTQKSLSNMENLIHNSDKLKSQIKQMKGVTEAILDESVIQAKKAVRFFKSNWKVVVPVVAVAGIGAYLLHGRSETKTK